MKKQLKSIIIMLIVLISVKGFTAQNDPAEITVNENVNHESVITPSDLNMNPLEEDTLLYSKKFWVGILFSSVKMDISLGNTNSDIFVSTDVSKINLAMCPLIFFQYNLSKKLGILFSTQYYYTFESFDYQVGSTTYTLDVQNHMLKLGIGISYNFRKNMRLYGEIIYSINVSSSTNNSDKKIPLPATLSSYQAIPRTSNFGLRIGFSINITLLIFGVEAEISFLHRYKTPVEKDLKNIGFGGFMGIIF